MRPLKLHTKTTLLASAITVAVLAVTLAYTTARVAGIVRDEQKARAELQALSFAEQISAMPIRAGPPPTRGPRTGLALHYDYLIWRPLI